MTDMSNLNFSTVLQAWSLFLGGVGLTVLLTLISCLLGTLLGIVCAWCRVHATGWLRAVVTVYVEFFRNTPFLVQIFFIYFGLPSIGLRMSSLVASIVALTLNLTAYACEIVRAGIEATPRGQIEAAQSLALDDWQIFTRVVIPPALARIWAGLISQLVIILLASSLCSQISTMEISYVASFIVGRTFQSFQPYVIATVLYLLLAISLREFLKWLGPRFIFGRQNPGSVK
jgi:polar amino acid transport system permease protein